MGTGASIGLADQVHEASTDELALAFAALAAADRERLARILSAPEAGNPGDLPASSQLKEVVVVA